MPSNSKLALVLLAMCNCNRVFGITTAQPVDAKYFDGLADAASACPPIGTVPVFAHSYRQGVVQQCADFSASVTTGRALAICTDETEVNYVAEGPIDGPLVAAVGLEGTSDVTFNHVELGPDGDTAVVRSYTGSTNSFVVSLARRDATGWTVDEPFASAFLLSSGPTRGPNMHVLAEGADGLHELVDDGSGTWNDVATHTFTQLGTEFFSRLTLSADGLRLVASVAFNANDVYYGDRASMSDPFANLVPFPSAVLLKDAFMTEGCERLYFPTLDEVWFADQGITAP